MLLHKELFTPLQTTEQHLQIFTHYAHKLQDKRLLYAAEQQENKLACKCVTLTYQETALWEVIPGKSWDVTYQLVQSGLQGQVSLFSNAVMHFCTAPVAGDLLPKDPWQKRTVPCTRGWRRVAGASITNISLQPQHCAVHSFCLGKRLLS